MSEAPRRPLPSHVARAPWLPLGLSMAVWGGNIVVARFAVGEVSPMALVCLRWLVVSALVLAWTRRDPAAAFARVAPHWRYLAVMGALGYTISNSLLFFGAKYTSGLNIAVVTAVQPALVVLGAAIAYRARLTAPRVVGVCMTVFGVLLVATRGDLLAAGSLEFNFGDFIELLGIVAYSAFTVALRSKPDIPAFSLFVGLAVSALATSAPLLAWEIASGAFIWPTWKGWAAIGYVAVFTSIVGHIGWIRAVGIIGPSRAGVFQNLVPLIGAGLSVALLGEEFRWYHGAAFALVLAGIWVSERLGVR
jgi:drug/metabolite transporter (DMT)-like permease